jgi:CDP-glycerol glycerophosphotransferase (TagB/SpsB family)
MAIPLIGNTPDYILSDMSRFFVKKGPVRLAHCNSGALTCQWEPIFRREQHNTLKNEAVWEKTQRQTGQQQS